MNIHCVDINPRSRYENTVLSLQVGQPAEVGFREVNLGSDRTLTITEGETASVCIMIDNLMKISLETSL